MNKNENLSYFNTFAPFQNECNRLNFEYLQHYVLFVFVYKISDLSPET